MSQDPTPVDIRDAEEADAPLISAIYRATYGEDYTYPQFYDEHSLKKMIFSDDTVMLVAADKESGQILGTASVVIEVGAYTDLLGEFGRLAVHPEARGRRVGTLLMEGRLDRVKDRLHIGITEARVVHPYSQKIALRHGFAPVGFLPMKVRMASQREHVCLMSQYFGHALDMRRNNPRIVPQVYRMAGIAMDNVGIVNDVVVDEESASYPYAVEYTVQEMTAEGYSDLLRIERGRVRKREVFGPLRLHYGVFKLAARHSNYLIAREGGRIVGAIGFTLDKFERDVRVFELITLDDLAIRFLLDELVRRCDEELDIVMIEIDVSADAPRMQRTLLEIGFVPAAYVPAMAFHRVERRDVVKFVRLSTPLVLGDVALIPEAEGIERVVISAITEREVVPRISEVVDNVDLFEGLNEEQVQRMAAISGYQTYEAGEEIFGHGGPCDEVYLVISGEVAVELPGSDEPIGKVGVSESLGEIALLMNAPHFAAAIACTEVELGVLTRERLNDLVRTRPDIGLVLFRNLARGLGEKLHRADMTWSEQA